jgi:hypothetical protein
MNYANRPGALDSDRAGKIVLSGTLSHTTDKTSAQHRESADNYYRIVAVLNDRWRVIECHDGIQWVLQRRNAPEKARGDDWRGRSYCRTRAALIRCTGAYCGEIDPAAATVLASLPERIGLPDNNRALRWVAEHCRVSPATARTIAEHAGIGWRCDQ